MLDKGPLPEICNTTFSTAYGKYVTNKYGYAKTESSQLSTKTWSMACDWEALLKAVLTIHRLTGRKEVVQMLNNLNSCSSCNAIGLQNKSWDCLVASSKCMSNHMCKGIPVHTTVDNNDGVQETLTGKGKTHDTNMTLFQPICEGLF